MKELKEEKQERRSPREGRRREGGKSVGEGDVYILLDAEIANNDRPGGKSWRSERGIPLSRNRERDCGAVTVGIVL